MVVVLDTTWTPDGPAAIAGLLGVREIAERVLTSRDLIAEAAEQLDGWAERSGIIEAMAVDGTSFWYGERLRLWTWLLHRMLWIAIVEELLVAAPGATEIVCSADADEEVIEAARLIAARDRLAFWVETADAPASDTTVDARMSSPDARPWSTRHRRLRSLAGRILWRVWPPITERRRRRMARRLALLAREPEARLLMVQAHARQRVETPGGTRFLNPYLEPILDHLRGSRLEPIQVDIRARLDDDAAWRQLSEEGADRTLALDAVRHGAPRRIGGPPAPLLERALDVIAAAPIPLVVSGVDLGPALAARATDRARRVLPRTIADISEIRSLIRQLRPAGILLADEYHRQDWLAAAAAEGIPSAAVQHGVIYRWHTGYVHRTRPPELRLPERMYVFGRWEHALLTTTSVYRPDEVRTGGSPRLDLLDVSRSDRAAVRQELGIAPDDRLLLLSGTWGPMYRRFHYPIALARLFDRPHERIHLVIKLHPSERDEGPYRRVIEGVAAARGFAPPPITLVQSIDLYRLLDAADAHLGLHSTLLTEAVVTGTPNLLATGLAGSDLLGYIRAGVAVPVRDGGELAAALDMPRATVMREADREAFLAAHFEPGSASQRIANDLLGWMT